MHSSRIVLGIDVGGSSLKAAPVDVSTGRLTAEPQSIPTPQPSTPDAVAIAARRLADKFEVGGPVGCAFPSVVTRGIARTAANIDHRWIGANGAQVLTESLGRPVVFLNDADAAGIAEMELGAGRDCHGTVLLLTFGTGVGSALFVDGHLLPNTELGHLHLPRLGEVEEHASGRVRALEHLDWPAWAERANTVLAELHRLLWPDVFIIGGGLVEHYEQFSPLLRSRAEIRPAAFLAQAGIVGAALAAAGKR